MRGGHFESKIKKPHKDKNIILIIAFQDFNKQTSRASWSGDAGR
jgi:hypothetical protein